MDKPPPEDFLLPPEGLNSLQKKVDIGQFQDLEEGRIPTPVPHRVKTGSISKDSISFTTSRKTLSFLWEDVEFIVLGILLEPLGDCEPPKYWGQRIVRKLFTGNFEKKEQKKEYRDTHLLDIYIKGEDSPYRIDPSTINYRGFLDTPGYISSRNFYALFRRITSCSFKARLNPNAVLFLTNKKEGMIKHNTVYDFELETQIQRQNLNNFTPAPELETQSQSQNINNFTPAPEPETQSQSQNINNFTPAPELEFKEEKQE